MEQGNLVEWKVKEGDTVAPGDVLADIETDKATLGAALRSLPYTAVAAVSAWHHVHVVPQRALQSCELSASITAHVFFQRELLAGSWMHLIGRSTEHASVLQDGKRKKTA